MWLEDTSANRHKFRLAFKEYSSIDYFMFEGMQIIPGWTYFHLNNGVRLDLMLAVKGLEDVSFSETYRTSNKADIDGVIVPFLQINQLIASKKAANRPKDQLDVIYLEKIKKLLDEQAND